MNDNVYIHEFIDIIGHNRANYMHHMTANFSPMAQEDRNQLCFGVWGIVGTTRGWPEVLNLWEERGFDGLATSFRFELGHSTLQDPKLAKWWAEASNYRRHGDDRVLVPAPWSPTITELVDAGVKGETYAHEQVHVPMGTARDFLEIVAEEAIPVYEEFGWKLCGAWETAMVNESECFLHWAIPTWESWAETEHAERQRQRAAALAAAHLRAHREVAPLPRGRRPALADAHRSSARTRPTAPRVGTTCREIGRSARGRSEHDVGMVERVVLAGDVVTLRPMTIDDVDGLVAAASRGPRDLRVHAGARGEASMRAVRRGRARRRARGMGAAVRHHAHRRRCGRRQHAFPRPRRLGLDGVSVDHHSGADGTPRHRGDRRDLAGGVGATHAR